MARGIIDRVGGLITIAGIGLIGILLFKLLKPIGVVDDVKSLFTDTIAGGSKEADNKARIEDTAKETQDVVQTEGTKTRDKVEEAKQDVTKTVTSEGKSIRTQAQELARHQRIRDAKIHAKTRLLLKHDKQRNVITSTAPKAAPRTLITLSKPPTFKRQNTAPRTEGFNKQSGAGQNQRLVSVRGRGSRVRRRR